MRFYIPFSVLGLFGLCCGLLLSGCGQSQQVGDRHATAHVEVSQAPRVLFQEGARGDDPVHLLIPAIHIDTAIEPVGVLSTGNLDTPQQNPWEDAGWYKDGPRPGEQGSAVIDGHLNRPGGAPAVFWYLSTLKAGDEVIVTTSEGKKLRYRVTGGASYAPQQAPLQDIFGDTQGYHLNLITCAGYWIPSEQQTSLRMVVYTSLE